MLDVRTQTRLAASAWTVAIVLTVLDLAGASLRPLLCLVLAVATTTTIVAVTVRSQDRALAELFKHSTLFAAELVAAKSVEAPAGKPVRGHQGSTIGTR